MYIMSALLSEICKIQNEYEKAEVMLEETLKCSNTSSWSDPAINFLIIIIFLYFLNEHQ